MKHKLYLGFDYGTQKIGVAVGQSLTQTARPLCVLKTPVSKNTGWAEFDKLLQAWKPHALVVGVPLGFEERKDNVAKKARAFASSLGIRYKLPVHEVDEVLSTRAAHSKIEEQKNLKRKHHQTIDDLAAQLILETWLSD